MTDKQFWLLLGTVWIAVAYAADAAGSLFGQIVADVMIFVCLAMYVSTGWMHKLWVKRQDAR